jgi:hypothetical protein
MLAGEELERRARAGEAARRLKRALKANILLVVLLVVVLCRWHRLAFYAGLGVGEGLTKLKRTGKSPPNAKAATGLVQWKPEDGGL